jgi:hypothetical protein
MVLCGNSAFNNAMPKGKKRAAAALPPPPEPAAPRTQPTLDGFYQPSGAIVLKSGRRVQKTIKSKSKGNFISDKFAIRSGELTEVNVSVRGKAERGRLRKGKVPLKASTKTYHMSKSKQQALMKSFGCFETVTAANNCV